MKYILVILIFIFFIPLSNEAKAQDNISFSFKKLEELGHLTVLTYNLHYYGKPTNTVYIVVVKYPNENYKRTCDSYYRNNGSLCLTNDIEFSLFLRKGKNENEEIDRIDISLYKDILYRVHLHDPSID